MRTKEPVTIEVELLRFELTKGFVESIKGEVVAEGQLEVYVNSVHHATFLCSMCQIRELVIGHLIAEGLINKPQEVKNLKINKGKVQINLARKPAQELSAKPPHIFTSCRSRSSRIHPRLLMKTKRTSDSSFKANPQTILKAVAELNSLSLVFRRTGGTHAAALLDENGKVVVFSEDIGRHNALDKVIGKAILEGIDLRRTFLASTGRLTSEIVVKAVYAGVPVIVSISAPTDKAIKMAETAGLTLIGFARGNRFNIYTHSDRVLF